MAIAKMTLVNIDGDIQNIDDAMLKCAQSGNFHPEQTGELHDGGFSVYSQANPYESLLKKISEIGMHAGIDLESMEGASIDRLHLNHIDNFTGKINAIREHTREMTDLVLRNEGETIPEDQVLFSPLLKFRIGRISNKTLRRIKKEERDDCLFFTFPMNRRYSTYAYVTTETQAKEVDARYANYGFERIIVPTDVLSNLHSIQEYEEQNEDFDINREELAEYMERFDRRILDMNEKKNELAREVAMNEQALIQLSHIEGLDVTFDDLFACEYVKIRFGRLPRDSYNKLQYYDENLFIFCTFDNDDEYYWGVYFTPRQYVKEIDAIFTSLFFERIRIPGYVHDTPEESRRNIIAALREGKDQLAAIENELVTTINKRKLYFYWLYAKVKYLSDSFDMRKYVSVYDDMFHLVGFVPTDEADAFKEGFEKISGITVTLRPSDSEPRLTPPTKLKNNRFMAAFEMFTEMYGLPAYSDIDPTPFVAVTYTLLFGAMFGDLGQGLFICLVGAVLWKKKGMALGRVMQRIGISSAFFGLIYGEVFGFEHVLDPMFHALGFAEKPIHIMDSGLTNTILIAAIGMGVTLIVASMMINVYVGIKKKDVGRAIFSPNGVVGMLLYLTILGGVACTMLTDIVFFTTPVIIALVVMVLLLFLKELIVHFLKKEKKSLFEGGVGSFFLESFFELFEILLSFVTNTLSFLRVGGFVLSHAGMMSVVFALSNMVSGGGTSPMVVIIGNLFVMCLEGLIVGIQTLRLEFYEMFSRFMEDSGKEFEPIRLGSPEHP